MEKGETGRGTVLPMERQTSTGEVPTTEVLTVKQKKNEYLLKATKHVGLDVFHFYVDHSGHVVKNLKTKACP